MKDVVSLVVGLAAAGVAIWQAILFFKTTGAQTGGNHAIYAGVAIVIAIICGAIFFAGRVNKEEEIHITQ
jgi:multidrug transporter EmrE-like cation transporter